MNLYYFKNKGNNEYEIVLSGDVGEHINTREVAREIRYLNTIGATKITERINSPGGYVVEGYDIVDANITSNAIIETIITGLAASTAGWLAATGTKGHRFIVDYGKAMVHDPALGMDKIEDLPDGSDKEGLIQIKDSIATILSNHSNLNKNAISEMMTKETWMDAKTWVRNGFADKVITTADKPVIKENYTIMEFVNACDKFKNFNQNTSRTNDNEPNWGGVNKRELPKAAFAGNDSDNPSEWSYPHHFVEGGSVDEDTGRFTSGQFYLHKGGLNAAWAAAMGARTGEKASQVIIDHLQMHRKQLGLTDNTDKMKKVLTFLNLSEDASEDSALNAVKDISKKVTDTEKQVADQKTKIDELTNKVSEKDTEIKNLKTEIDEYKTKEIENAVKSAIDSGKFSEDNKEELTAQAKTMGAENFAKFIEMVKLPKADAAAQVNNGVDGNKKTTDEKLAEEYQELADKDPRKLREIRDTQPEKFKKMLAAWNEWDNIKKS